MRMRRITVLWMLGVALGCCTPSQDSPPDYVSSSCRVCERRICATDIAGCEAEATCAGYLSCLDRCGLDTQGAPQAACESACTAGLSSRGSKAYDALRTCTGLAREATCIECGLTVCEGTKLSQTCGPPLKEDMGKNAACRNCIAANCCQTQSDCLADKSTGGCASLYEKCILGAPDFCTEPDKLSTERYKCFKEHQPGLGLWGKHFACVSSRCAEGDSCLEDPCKPGPSAGLPCAQCQRDRCGCLTVKFNADPQAILLNGCLSANKCGANESCIKNCADLHPRGIDPLIDELTCSSERCSNVCGGN